MLQMYVQINLFVIFSLKSQEIKKSMASKLNWNIEEQEFLKQIVENKQKLTWNEIAVEMGKKFPDKGRTGKQYRQRYVNYVQFQHAAPKKNNWTTEQENSLFKEYRQIGTKWTQIAKIIPTKSQNSLKNKFYGAIRKALRKINRIGKQNIKKFNKPIRYESLIRIMDAAEGGEDLPLDIKNDSQIIKEDLLKMAEHCEEKFDVMKVSEIIKQIHKFNIATRCYSSKKWKRNSGSTSDVKQQSNESCCLDEEKACKQEESYENKGYLYKSAPAVLQQNGRLFKENFQNKEQKEDTKSMCEIKIEQLLDQSPIQANIHRVGANLANGENVEKQKNDDLEFQLCGILKQNYVPHNFNFFEE